MSLSLPEQSSRNRSASTGDSGLPKHEHKRPRLSETPNDNQDEPSASISENKSSPSLPPTSALTTPPQSPLPLEATTDATSPKSKVTINTRPISSQSSAAKAQSESDNSTMPLTNSKQDNEASSMNSMVSNTPEQHETISISSSDCGSPIIQIAAPEDMDQDPANTQWEPISKPSLPRRLSIHSGFVQRTFPFVGSHPKGQATAAVAYVAKVFAEGAANDEDAFAQVKTWLVSFVDNATNLSYDYFAEDREFWQKLPALIVGLLKRKIDPPCPEIRDLVELFVTYTRLTTLMINNDAKKLENQVDNIDPKTIAIPQCLIFLPQVQNMIVPDGIPLYENLQDSLNYNPAIVTELVMDCLREEYAEDHVKSMMRLFRAMAVHFSRKPTFLDPAMNIALHTGGFVNLMAIRVNSMSDEGTDNTEYLRTLQSLSTEFLQHVNATLDLAISKQQPWLNIETCEKLFRNICPFVGILATNFSQLAIDVVQAANLEPAKFSGSELSLLSSTAWKFATLLKFIKKGRMEVRVACVQIMAQDLVDVYHEHIRSTYRNLQHPKVTFMNWFIRQNDIIRYMIGVDSHPQIIDRCANIIGFLCVSQCYRNEDTDIIWQTVLDSQDPRAVVALLGVFQQNLENLEIDILCYIAGKLLAVPFARVDGHMLDFALQVINVLYGKVSRQFVDAEEETQIDAYVIGFCLKMFREACVPGQICAEISARIRMQLRNVLTGKIRSRNGRLKLGEDTDLMKPLLQELAHDIHTHNKFASGSNYAFGCLLAESSDEETFRVVQAHDIAKIFVDDMEHACKLAIVSGYKDSTWLEFESRFNLMMILIHRMNHAFTGSLLTALWTNLLSSPSLNAHFRSAAWNALASIFEVSRLRNEALDRLVDNYLPELSPDLHDEAVLRFVQQSIKYEMCHTPIELMEPKDIVVIPGIERIWTIMLTAAPNTIELPAADFIIEQYIEGDCVRHREISVIQNTHLALIDRCVKQVIEAANYLKSDTVTPKVGVFDGVDSDGESSELNSHAMVFHRSLRFLRRFLDVLKTKPRYTPVVSDLLRRTLTTFDKKGQFFEVTLQIMGHRTLASAQLKWLVGNNNTGAEIWHFLADITGWSDFMVISGGRRINLKDEEKKIQDIGIKTGSFIINKSQGSSEAIPLRAARASSPVDSKVMHHFDELYNLLELENQYAKEVFDFLSMFSSQEGIVQKLRSMKIASEQLLPVNKPFKLMYYARALRSCIEDESFSSEPNTEFLTYSIHSILPVLPRLNNLNTEITIYMSIAQSLIEALVLGFRAKVPLEVSVSYIEDGALFSKTVLSLWTQALEVSLSDAAIDSAVIAIRAPFEVLVEALLHDERLWTSVPREIFKDCLERSLLTHPQQNVRQAILEVVYGLTGSSNPKLAAKSGEARSARKRFAGETIETFLEHLWPILLELLPHTHLAAATCEEYYDAISSIFRQHHSKIDDFKKREYSQQWKACLLAHQYKHRIGLAPQDFLISSLGKLLLQVLKVLPSAEEFYDASFIRQLFTSFLFPSLSESLSFDASQSLIQEQHQEPVLDMNTRRVLYDLVLFFSHDETCLDVICDEMSGDLIPKDFDFQPTMNNDRYSLRSEVGYSGLRNLSNTCYLNSLLSQLFMNLEFRELVMNVNIIDFTKQKLVSELGKVFAYMQASYEEAVSPETAIEAITLWDGESIDVTVQMDVDEFFNLLFDRLESQIVDPKVCTVFKSIYGDQLVQQIKSKECEHVSERLEPFAAVQVEIKGKATLEESLRAYVEGEVLQGENKYSCTGCGKHVDAIKRACLKTVPDHLIFNLKRFDYDIMTGMRCKVNDEFGFPEMIDMTPYTLDALTNPETGAKQDIFELVGIIIHSGTAESGHYYSYIRQRPSLMSKEKSWVQFNDHDVSQFDPASIKECCFGGIEFGAIQHAKFYNGYMLFYQRSSSIRKFQHKYLPSDSSTPVGLSVKPLLESHITQHNELFLRSYVVQDPIHAKFIRSLVEAKQKNEQLRCSTTHNATTTKVLTMALDYIHQVSSRWKDLPDVEETVAVLRNYAADCMDCTKIILSWFTKEDNLSDTLIRSCYVAVRKSFASLIALCWDKWADYAYRDQNASGEAEHTAAFRSYLNGVRNFLAIMSDGWDLLQRHGRSWETFFAILSRILHRGKDESRQMLEVGFLEHALEFVHMHVLSPQPPKRVRVKYSTYLYARERNRLFAHNLLIQFLADLLQHVDLARITDYGDRMDFDGKIGPSQAEVSLLGVTGQNPQLTWLRKAIWGRANPEAANSMIRYLCESGQFDILLWNLLKESICERHLQYASICLQPAVVFVSNCAVQELIVELVDNILVSIETTSGQYGKDFLTFLQDVAQAMNESASIPRGALKSLVKKNISSWAPTLLMAPNDIHADVRSETVMFLNEILFSNMETLKNEDPRRYRQDVTVCKILANACAGYAQTYYLGTQTPTLQAGQAAQVSRVVNHCLLLFGDSASEEEEAANITAIMEEFKTRAESVVETITEADWNGSSDLEAMSEVDNLSDTSN